MIEIISILSGHVTKSKRHLVFIDNILVGMAARDYIINPEYEKFIIEYETFNKEQRNAVHGPVKWLFNGYKPYSLWDEFDLDLPLLVYSGVVCKTEQELEEFFKNAHSKETILKNCDVSI